MGRFMNRYDLYLCNQTKKRYDLYLLTYHLIQEPFILVAQITHKPTLYYPLSLYLQFLAFDLPLSHVDTCLLTISLIRSVPNTNIQYLKEKKLTPNKLYFLATMHIDN